MKEVWYTVSQASKLLQLHEKTVQRFIREGRLPAQKVGRSYRISGHDLSLFTQGDTGKPEPFAIGPDLLKQQPSATAVVDCFVGDKEQAIRISNSFNAVMNSKLPEDGQGRYDFVYFEEDGRGKLIFYGPPLLVSRLLQIAHQLLQKEE